VSNPAPQAPSPVSAAQGQLASDIGEFPFQQEISNLAQTGGNATLINPTTGQPEDYNFTNLGTANVQNTVSSQMAQTLLGIQQNLGPQYVQLALQNLQQSDPTGYAAYEQLFNQIQQEAAQNPPDQPLSEATQSAINNILQGSQTLNPQEQTEATQAANAGNVANGILLGNAPQQAVVNSVVGATDANNQQAQGAAEQYLSEGVSPADIAFRTLQQNLSNEGAFVSGQNPTAEFSSLSGAAQGAAPTLPTGYQSPSINETQAAGQGITNANNLFSAQSELANAQANPYLAGLNFGIQGISTGLNANPNLIAELTGGSQYNSPYYQTGAQPFAPLPGSTYQGTTFESAPENYGTTIGDTTQDLSDFS
jgi:hypothetical protein